MNFRYKYSIVGGTFDKFHLGHQKLLEKTFELSENIAIGITTDNLNRGKFLADLIDSYETREKNLKHFLGVNNLLKRTIIGI